MSLGSRKKCIGCLLIAAVMIVYCGLAEFAEAQTAAPTTQQAPEATQQQAAPQPGSTQQSLAEPQTAQSPTDQQNAPTGIVDPSQGPLAPVPQSNEANTNELPNAPSAIPAQGQNTGGQPPQQPPSLQEPVGTAAAQVGPTAGGAASKPAGNAIAPAKQRQTRSFLIKLGAVAAAGVAIGTVVALSKGTSSNPPGAR